MTKDNNLAFVDGQNLHMGTSQDHWKVDFKKFRIYIKDKYHVTEAYYFLGYASEAEQKLYTNLQKAGFIVVFKEHHENLKANKKGNVDTDVVFEIMKNLIDNKDFNKIILVSGDGYYKKLIDFLIEKNKLEKMLFPNKKFASSLYKKLGSEFYDYLENIKTYVKFDRNEKGS